MQLALWAIEARQVGQAPEDGRQGPGKAHAHNLVHGEVAPKLDELPQGLILERLQLVFLAIDGGEEVLGEHFALLDGSLSIRRDASTILLVDVRDGGAVTDGPDVRMALNSQVLV